jgi:hypothetical protein
VQLIGITKRKTVSWVNQLDVEQVQKIMMTLSKGIQKATHFILFKNSCIGHDFTLLGTYV